METNSYSDQEYIDGIVSNDNHVCREIYRLMRPKALNLLIRYGARTSEAEDAFSNGMVALFVKAKKGTLLLKGSARFETFLSSICLRQLSNIKKKKSKTNLVTNDVFKLLKDDDDVDHDLITASRFRLYMECMKRIDQKCQEVLYAFLVERISLKEIAIRFNTTAGFAKKKKWSCQQKLIKHIQQHPDFLSLKLAQ